VINGFAVIEGLASKCDHSLPTSAFLPSSSATFSFSFYNPLFSKARRKRIMPPQKIATMIQWFFPIFCGLGKNGCDLLETLLFGLRGKIGVSITGLRFPGKCGQ